MQVLCNIEECTGCGACFAICPQKAIKMEEDEEGFLYPVVNKENQQILIRDDMIDYWDLNLVVIDGNPDDIKSYKVLGSIKYSDFIAKLPKDKYSFIDASYILVEGLNREEIENLLK